MDLIAYWNVVKRRQRIVVVGLCITAALALASMVRPTASGISWRTPPVYDAATTLLVTQPGFPEGRVGDPSADTSPQLADSALLYSRLAGSDFIERAVSRKLKLEEPDYDASPLAGTDGRPLPLFQIRAYELSPEGAVALANGVSNALRRYLAREQANNRITGDDRVELKVYEEAQEAEVFQGVRLTRPIMLFLLGALLTLAVAFVVDNLRGGRRRPPAEQTGEPDAPLGIVRNESEDDEDVDEEPPAEQTGEPDSPLGIVRNEPEDDEDVDEEPPAARGRWAAPS